MDYDEVHAYIFMGSQIERKDMNAVCGDCV